MTMVVEVAIERAVGGLDRLWSYLPGPLDGVSPKIGYRVAVPLGRASATGIILAERDVDAAKFSDLKTISRVLDDHPALTPALASLALWMSDRYLCFIGQTVRAMIPPGVRQGLAGRAPEPMRWQAGVAPSARAHRQQEIFQWLVEHVGSTKEEVLAAFPHSEGPWLQLRKSQGAKPMGPPELDPIPSGPELNSEQARAVQTLSQGTGRWLLEGVTGSGKTEVYLDCIAAELDQGRQALVMVPEIALTPQTVSRFQLRFGQRVAVWHSGLSVGERVSTWNGVRQGIYPVVVGVRSAVFLPFPQLGLMVLDEEHETTYKQDEHPRYHAREVAEERARLEGAQLILGSATPSLETAYRARKGEIGWLTLTKRANQRSLPHVSAVDMRKELKQGNHEMFSRRLMEAITEALSRHQQVILFLNRRGYATYIFCRDCGQALSCPHCEVTLTYHQESNRISCHYCFFEGSPPPRCPACDSPRIRYFGAGTERVVEAVARIWPQARVLRADRDSLSGRASHERLWKTFSNHGADILVGTQMIAKGMDWPMVTLVGILAADVALNFPDFRSSERTFQLLVQAAGRAGRGEAPGQVVVQTYNPEHYAIRYALEANYEGFFQEEIGFRQQAGYPPFSQLWLLEVRSPELKRAAAGAQEVASMVRSVLLDDVQILGPAPAPLARVRQQYRFHVLLKATLPAGGALRQVAETLRDRSDVQITVDPYFML